MSRPSRLIAPLLMLAVLTALVSRGSAPTLAAPPPAPAAAPGIAAAPSFVTSFTLDSSDDTKYPDIDAYGNTVHMAGNPGQRASYWTKTDSATNASGRQDLGFAANDGKKPDYAPAAVTTGPDGTVYAAWISQGNGISMRKKPAGGAWAGTQTVTDDGSFRVYIDIGVTSNGEIFIAWNQDSLFQYTRSSDGGNHWTTYRPISSKTAVNRPNIATGPSGSLIITYGSTNGHIYASFWQSGSGDFSTADVTPSGGAYYADPSATIGPDGVSYVAWRAVGGGIYYAQRQPDGSWPRSKLAGGEAYGMVQIDADPQNNLHMFWPGNISGGWDLWYAFKPANGGWEGPVAGAGNANILADAAGAGTVSDKAYGHAVVERFSGSGMATRYYLFSAIGSQPPSAQPVIENNAAYTKKTTMSVAFTNVTASPAEVRWRWNAAPTDQASDSGGWQPFSSTISVSAPNIGANACQTLTLYTQVRNANFPSPTTTSQDSIIFDNGIQGSVAVLNPHMAGLAASYSAAHPSDLITQGGASDGAPNYTRDDAFYLNITNINECAGLKDFRVPGSFNTTPIPANGYQATIALPGDPSAGSKPVSVIVTDNAGNVMTTTTTMIYDPSDTNPDPTVNNTDGLPVLDAGAALTVDGDTGSILRSLSFTGFSVDDNYYGQHGEGLPSGRQFWGVWIAVSRTNVSPSDTSLRWVPVRVTNPRLAFTIDWSLFTGLNYGPTGGHDGTYYLYARALDGAGNPSARTVTATATLDSGYALPFQALPLLRR